MNTDTRASLTDAKQVKQNATKGLLGIGLALILAVAAFFSGVHIGTTDAGDTQMQAGIFSIFARTPDMDTEDVDLSEFWKVWGLLEEKFVTSSSTNILTDEEKIQGAIKGLVQSYDDPYTVFLPPTDAAEFDANISGNFGGVGMEVGIRDSLVTVIAPLPDTPAFQAGIVAGDVIVKIDDVSTEGMTIDDAVKLIRGEKGTDVLLTIFREGESGFLEISVTRDTITIPTVKTEEVDGVFIISLYSFNALAEKKMQEALREYVKSGTKKLILDMRGNPGGFLQSAVSIGSYFIPAGEVIVRENFGDGSPEELYRSQGKTLGKYAPEEMVVLVDGGSASASEILAGALSQHGVATLMGKTTFGKGSVQELVDLPDGSSLKVTIARWFTPDGTSISEQGLEPDVVIERTPQQIIADEDPQLEAAVQYLNGDKELLKYMATSTEELLGQ
jgi:carboxyl-terminal processing protease